jgi:hypothetical protein
MTYALGRGVEYYDMPAIRKILHDAEPGGYKMQSILLGIIKSYPFQFRRLDAPALEARSATPATSATPAASAPVAAPVQR